MCSSSSAAAIGGNHGQERPHRPSRHAIPFPPRGGKSRSRGAGNPAKDRQDRQEIRSGRKEIKSYAGGSPALSYPAAPAPAPFEAGRRSGARPSANVRSEERRVGK